MHERDRNRSLADARRYTFDGAVPHVADDKDAGNVRFQKAGLAIELPSVRPLAVARELRAGIDKTELITFDNVRQPLRIWRCPDHDEQRVSGNLVYLVRFGAMYRNRFEMIVAMRLNDRRVVFNLNVRR